MNEPITLLEGGALGVLAFFIWALSSIGKQWLAQRGEQVKTEAVADHESDSQRRKEDHQRLVRIEADIANATTILQVMRDRDDRLTKITIPDLRATTNSNTAKIQMLKIDLATFRAEMNRPSKFLTPPQGVPVIVGDEE